MAVYSDQHPPLLQQEVCLEVSVFDVTFAMTTSILNWLYYAAAPTAPPAGGGLFGSAATPAPAGGLFGSTGELSMVSCITIYLGHKNSSSPDRFIRNKK